MSGIDSSTLTGVSETLLVTLYIRALESERPDALIHDQRAVELVRQIDYDFSRFKTIHLSEANKLVIILRNHEFDRYAQDFLCRFPDAGVVHIGCGLDTRFERVDNGRVEWFDLDFPHVIELRRKLIGGEKERYHLLGCSALEEAWLESVRAERQRPFLFVAEGVFMYLSGAEVRSLILMLQQYFPGSELVFDTYSPLHLLVSNLQTARAGIHCQWGLWHGEEIEKWNSGIRLLDEWGYFDYPEARLRSIGWLRPIESPFRTMRIYHLRLSKPGS